VASGGTYRINDYEFNAPESAIWEDIPVAPGLNGIPFLSSYAHHVWQFTNLEACLAEDLMTVWQLQLSGNVQLTALETDPYLVDTNAYAYATTVYSDFIIMNVTPLARGLPEYDDVSVTFLVYVG
jgi:hypothetical protein